MWSFLGGRSSSGDRAIEQDPSADAMAPQPIEEPQRPQRSSGPLDSLGQRNELLRVRFSQMIDRLEDLKSLSDDFNMIIEPIEAIAVELPQAKARVMETQAMLSREVEASQILRREVDELTSRLSSVSGELASVDSRSRKLEAQISEYESALDEHRILLREKNLLVDNVERQLAAEVDQHASTAAELALQRADSETIEQSLQRAEAAVQRESEQHAIHERESRRLQQLAGEQMARIADLETRHNELADQRQINLQTIATLEARLVEAELARQKSASEQDGAIVQLTADRSSLLLKLDAVTARLTSTEQILSGVRSQFREKDEALRTAERSLKEALLERITADRRVEAVRGELAHHVDQLGEAHRLRNEFEERCEMLAKAMAAKDATLETSLAKAASLGDRLESLTKRYENDRMAQDAAGRRLIEELESEKAERTLAQGALEIARENRVALQRQNETLKRAIRALQTQGDPADLRQLSSQSFEQHTNVSFLAQPDNRAE
jgi:crescentin